MTLLKCGFMLLSLKKKQKQPNSRFHQVSCRSYNFVSLCTHCLNSVLKLFYKTNGWNSSQLTIRYIHTMFAFKSNFVIFFSPAKHNRIDNSPSIQGNTYAFYSLGTYHKYVQCTPSSRTFLQQFQIIPPPLYCPLTFPNKFHVHLFLPRAPRVGLLYA